MSSIGAVTDAVTSKNVDLTNCDREQIQYPGSIQPHGAMVVLSEVDLRILQASANCAELLGVSAETLLGGGAEGLLGAADIAALRARMERHGFDGAPVHIVRRQIAGRDFDLLAHRFDGVLILEFEARPAGVDSPIPELYSELQVSISRLGATTSLQAFLDLGVRLVRDFTGFDRVMAYEFLEDGSGAVRAEALTQGLEPFLGLHFPPSDIPAPARRLFSLTWVRHQPDIGYRPVPMIPENNPVTDKPLDMSYAFLRSVSIMYVDYLKNMGTHASMVMTLMKDGNLWGLIACHHHSGPRHVPYEVRVAAEFLAHMVSTLMSAKENVEHNEYRMHLQSTEKVLIENVSRVDDFALGLTGFRPSLMDFIDCTGAACVVNGVVSTVGTTPGEDQIAPIVRWLSQNLEKDVFAADCLSSLMPEAAAFPHQGAGVLALRFSKSVSDFLLWFRPEAAQTVSWAGDPSKPVDISDDGQRLLPRTSFALWQESVRLTSRPWTAIEMAAAKSLRFALLELVLERAETLGKLYEELERSHAELDSFAHVAAHDLKEPLRGIHSSAQMLEQDQAVKLGDQGVARVATIIRLSKRMDELINALLLYSKVGRALEQCDVDLNEVLKDALDSVDARIQEHGVLIRLAGPLPTLKGDPERLREVFTNLISNGIKYNDKPFREIEIGHVEGGPGQPTALYVKDNGIGIEKNQHTQIFRIFERLHHRDAFGGGTGAGLTIVKKIVERHGGRVWVESAAGEGSTFYFTLSSLWQK